MNSSCMGNNVGNNVGNVGKLQFSLAHASLPRGRLDAARTDQTLHRAVNALVLVLVLNLIAAPMS